MTCTDPSHSKDILLIENCKICEVRVLSIISGSGTYFEIGGKHKFWAIDSIFVLVYLLFLLKGFILFKIVLYEYRDFFQVFGLFLCYCSCKTYNPY